MKRKEYEFLIKQPVEYLISPAVSMEDFDFVINNCNKNINDIEFEND